MTLCVVVVITTTAHLHSTKPEPRLNAGSNPACSVSEICNGEDICQCSWVNSQEKTCARESCSMLLCYKRDSGKGIILWILQNLWKCLLWRTSANSYFCHWEKTLKSMQETEKKKQLLLLKTKQGQSEWQTIKNENNEPINIEA